MATLQTIGTAMDGIALVTEAAGIIGRDTGFAFAEVGCQGVVFADINEDGARDAAEESNKYAANAAYQALAIKVDVADLGSVNEMVQFAIKHFGRVDYCVHAAAVHPTVAKEISDDWHEIYEWVMRVNTGGVMNVLHAVSKAMLQQEPRQYTPKTRRALKPRDIGRGAIVAFGSIYSFISGRGTLSYSISKRAILGATQGAAADLAKNGIRVNTVCPGAVDTPHLERLMEEDREFGEKIKRIHLLYDRLARPDEVSSLCVWLCGPEANYVTGQAWQVDAGATIMR